MEEGSDLSQHLNVFNQIISDLMRINVKFEYEDKALILLNSLIASPTYENLATTPMWGEKKPYTWRRSQVPYYAFIRERKLVIRELRVKSLWLRVARNVVKVRLGMDCVGISLDLNP